MRVSHLAVKELPNGFFIANEHLETAWLPDFFERTLVVRVIGHKKCYFCVERTFLIL
jgi:hypothetical protein